VHPDGLGARASTDDLYRSIDKPTPDFGGIAKAAAGGDIFAAKVDMASMLQWVLKKAIEAVQAGQSAVVDCTVTPGS
jgi:hypothetical protein